MGGFSEQESPPSLPVSPGATLPRKSLKRQDSPLAPVPGLGTRSGGAEARRGAGLAWGQREGAAAPLAGPQSGGGGGPPSAPALLVMLPPRTVQAAKPQSPAGETMQQKRQWHGKGREKRTSGCWRLQERCCDSAEFTGQPDLFIVKSTFFLGWLKKH